MQIKILKIIFISLLIITTNISYLIAYNFSTFLQSYNPYWDNQSNADNSYFMVQDIGDDSSHLKIGLSHPEIDKIVSSIDIDSLAWFVQKLEDFGTRFLFADNRFEVSEWIAEQFKRFGYTNVYLDPFTSTASGVTADQLNVIAILEGSHFPDDYVIIGAHHDCFAAESRLDYNAFAPGADDNASGTATVLEIARVLKLLNFQPLNSIRFMTYAMEEYGMHGSYYDAQKISEEGMNVNAMFNLDMLGNQPDDEDWIFRIIRYPNADFLHDKALKSANLMDMNIFSTYEGLHLSDGYPYFLKGIPVIYFYEYYFSPHYHQNTDLLINLNLPYMFQYSKLITSVFLDTVNLPAHINNFNVYDLGKGNSLHADWEHSDFEKNNYLVLVKNTETLETQEFETTQNFIIIDDLSPEILYEISLYAIYDDIISSAAVRYIEIERVPIYDRLFLKNYPNPFNPFTTIEFTLPADDYVEITIYNIRGQLVKFLTDDFFQKGQNTVQWDGKSDYGNLLSSGVYFYQAMTTNGVREVNRMVLLK